MSAVAAVSAAVATRPAWPRRAFLLAGLALAAFHLGSLGQPLAHEELTWSFQLARSLAEGGRMLTLDGQPFSEHPPLYTLLLAGVFRLAGPGAVPARLLGLALGLLALLVWARLLGAVRERLAPDLPPALAAAAYALHPVLLQATLLLEADVVLGPLTFLLFADHAVRSDLLRGRRAVVEGGLLLVPIMMVRVYHVVPLLLALAVVLARRQGARAAAGRLAGLGGIGLGAFVLAWLPLSHLLAIDPWEPLRYAARTATARVAADPLGRALAVPWDAVQVLLWLSPPLVLVAHAVALRALGGPAKSPAAPAAGFLALWAVLHVDLFAAGIGPLYGFPRYHVAAVPLLLAVALLALASPRPMAGRAIAIAAVLGAIAAVGLWPVTGDLLWQARIGLKEAVLAGAALAPAVAGWGLRALAVLALPALLLLAWPGRPRTGRQLAALALVASHTAIAVSLLATQAGAGYATRYAYGEQGLGEVVALLQRGAAPGRVVAPLHVTQPLGAPALVVTDRFWEGAGGELRRLVADGATCCLIYSVAHHSLAQLRYLDGLGPALEREGFRRRRVGSFVVWLRPRS